MGHAGAIVSGSRGTAAAKAEALESKGVRVGRTPTQVAERPPRCCAPDRGGRDAARRSSGGAGPTGWRRLVGPDHDGSAVGPPLTSR